MIPGKLGDMMTSICSDATHLLNVCSTPVDWAATGTYLSGVGTLLGAMAVTYGATQGFKLWRRQKLAERNMESAERIMAASYQARRALEQVRNAWMDGREEHAAHHEIKDAPSYANSNDERKRRMVVAQVYINRLRSTAKAQEALDECGTSILALVDPELNKAMEHLYRQFGVLQVFIEEYPDATDPADDFTQAIKAALYQRKRAADDEISLKVAKFIGTIEDRCKPYLTEEANEVFAKLAVDGVTAVVGKVV
ncbi:MAG: hypothetical protein A3H25_10715 [Sphingomonadales bacterium RIFCSPLOWO2_12_FULL_63_15]|nr:MAG: hypothetical protein A3H25_10715 [Sphingomonadales bacterium RIFCSPLOWO2_12_FULL_63_15]